MTWTVAAVGARPPLAMPRIARRGSLDSALRGRRPVYFPEKGGWVDTPGQGRDELSPGVELAGLAVIEDRESTTVLPPDFFARVDDHGSLVVEVSGSG